VRLEISLQEQLSPVAHDPHGVTQILLNLLDNAVKYAASGRVVQVRLTRDTLLAEVWGHPQDIVTRTVDNFILRLRKKIEPDPAHPRHLLTVHGSGYKLVA
jgi:Response regulators consisting of a CheY-like receiver domain and a winged-helix DNA-binding domain